MMAMQLTLAMNATNALLAVQATLAGMASLGRLGAGGCVVRHALPKDSRAAHHERGGAGGWLDGLGAGGWVVRHGSPTDSEPAHHERGTDDWLGVVARKRPVRNRPLHPEGMRTAGDSGTECWGWGQNVGGAAPCYRCAEWSWLTG